MFSAMIVTLWFQMKISEMAITDRMRWRNDTKAQEKFYRFNDDHISHASLLLDSYLSPGEIRVKICFLRMWISKENDWKGSVVGSICNYHLSTKISYFFRNLRRYWCVVTNSFCVVTFGFCIPTNFWLIKISHLSQQPDINYHCHFDARSPIQFITIKKSYSAYVFQMVLWTILLASPSPFFDVSTPIWNLANISAS